MFVDLFLDAHKRPPTRIILDLDATDDPIDGSQEGRFFHGYYDGYCYLPLYVFCGDHLLAAKLRRANIDASAGAVEKIARIGGRIRAAWPRVKVLLRGDSGFALDLFADRTSSATMRANQLRLWFASMAYALPSALRRRALAHTELVRATCGTIRAKLLKIGALVTVSARRVRVAMPPPIPTPPSSASRIADCAADAPSPPRRSPPANCQLHRSSAHRPAQLNRAGFCRRLPLLRGWSYGTEEDSEDIPA